METSASQAIIDNLDGMEITDRRRFRQVMRREMKKTGLEYEVKDKVYYVGGKGISFLDDEGKVVVQDSDHVVVAKDKRESVASEKTVGGKKKRKKKLKKDGYPHTPDALELKNSLSEYLNDPANGIEWYERINASRPTEMYYAISLWSMSRVTRDPKIFVELLEAKVKAMKVKFADPDNVEWFFMAPGYFWIGPVVK